jgi:hypothetical protein
LISDWPSILNSWGKTWIIFTWHTIHFWSIRSWISSPPITSWGLLSDVIRVLNTAYMLTRNYYNIFYFITWIIFGFLNCLLNRMVCVMLFTTLATPKLLDLPTPKISNLPYSFSCLSWQQFCCPNI